MWRFHKWFERNVNNYQRITIIGIDISIGEHATTHAHLHKLCLLRRSCFTHQLTPDVTCLHWSHTITHTHTHSHKHQTHAIHTLRINCFADIAIHNTKVYVWIKKKFFLCAFFFFLHFISLFFRSRSTQFWIIHIIRAEYLKLWCVKVF